MLTSKEIMVNVLLNIFTLTGDVEQVDTISMVTDTSYQEQIYCLSLNSYFETRGGSFEDKVSVAQAVLARVKNKKEFRNYHSPCDVVTKSNRYASGKPKLHQCWYSWYCDGNKNIPHIYFEDGSKNVLEYEAWEQSVTAAFYAYHKIYPNLIQNATHYYNDKIASPYWSNDYAVVARVGDHIFSK